MELQNCAGGAAPARNTGRLVNFGGFWLLLALVVAAWASPSARAQTGACCDGTTASCMGGVSAASCADPFDSFFAGKTCSNLPEPCVCETCGSCSHKVLGSREAEIALVSAVYNGTNTVFTYKVCEWPTSQSISHFVIGLSSLCCSRIVSTTGFNQPASCATDPTTGQYGLKFETNGVPNCNGVTCGGGGATFKITLSGQVGTGCIKSTKKIASGSSQPSGCVLGPNCNPDLCAGVTCPGATGPCDGGQSCNPQTGQCVNNPDPGSGTPCNADGNLCTNDQCNGTGSCVNVSGVSCPGPTNPCDGGKICNPATGACVDSPDTAAGTSCQADSSLCTIDQCNGTGSCVKVSTVSCPGPVNECDGGQVCNPGTGICQHLADDPAGTPCNTDGNLCTIDECDGSGNCVFDNNVTCPGPTGPCDGGTQCNPATGGCAALPDSPSGTSCDADDDACTVDECDGSGNCVFKHDISCPGPTGECDGGQACVDGVCVNVPDDPAGTSCEADGNLCTIDRCDGAGNCVLQSNVDCAHLADACNNAACNPTTGQCVVTPKPLSTPCEADGNLCTTDYCNGSGVCMTFGSVSCPGSSGECDGGQSCNPATGTCTDLPDSPFGTPCEADGNLCTIDKCNGSGSCLNDGSVMCPGPAGECDGGQACNPATGLCEDAPDDPAGTTCEADGNLCTIDECDGSGACMNDSSVDCSHLADQCHNAACNPATGTCATTPKVAGTLCEVDGNLCTLDECDGSGTCATEGSVTCPGPTGDCDGGKACQPATGMCIDAPDVPAGTNCEADGNLCTLDECNGGGQCVNDNSINCSHLADQCNNAACNPSTGTCVVTPKALGTSCEADGNLCTTDQCDGAGDCVNRGQVSCPAPVATCDGGQVCNPATGTCVNAPEAPAGTTCEADGDLCTLDECDGAGNCANDSSVGCSHLADQCNNAACSPSTGTCVVTPKPESTQCEADGNLCTNDHCDGAGTCVLLDTVTCPGPTGSCDGGKTCQPSSGACVDLPDSPLGMACERDDNLCTHDQCDGTGICVTFDNVSCPGANPPCDEGAHCDPNTGLCVHLPDPPVSTPCEADGNLCTLDHCDGNGACVYFDDVECPGPGNSCDGGTTCDPANGACAPLPDSPAGISCEADGNFCTTDVCNGAGICVSSSMVGCSHLEDECNDAACNPANGSCVVTPKPLSTECEADGNLCTIDHCDGSGTCVTYDNVSCPGPSNSCDGGTACTPSTGACDPLPDPAAGTSCEADGNLCTTDVCSGSGMCVTQSTTSCAHLADQCNGAACNPLTGACVLTPKPLSNECEADGNLCTIDHCDGAGDCVLLDNVDCPGPANSCDGGSACNPMTGTCAPLADAPFGTSCEADGNLCTTDICDGSGHCTPQSTTNCSHLVDQCNDAACNPMTGLCLVTPRALSTPCQADSNLCTIDHCDGSGTCVTFDQVTCPGPTSSCDGGTVCNTMTGLCDNLPDDPQGTSCAEDGNLCTLEECNGMGNCVPRITALRGGAEMDCSHLEDQCNDAACDPMTGECVVTPKVLSTRCQADSDLCTIDHCDGTGACVPFDNVSCPGPTNECDGGQVCQPSTGLCADLPDPTFSTPCEADGNLCTNDHCNGKGSCVLLSSVSCPGPAGPCDGGQFCNPSTGGCTNAPDLPPNTPCESDGDLCTREHCDGNGNCVLNKQVSCPAAVPPCEGGTQCNPNTGKCDALSDPVLSTPCESDGNFCTVDHCDGMGNCVFLENVNCPGGVAPCEAGALCNPNSGECEDLVDAPLSTPCEADGELCTEDHCDGMGNCVLEEHVCGACCDGNTGDCEDEAFPEECVGDQFSFHLDESCDGIIATGECVRHSGACCNSAPGAGGACVDDVYPEDCTGPYALWHKNMDCSQINCTELRGACCDGVSGVCTTNVLQAACGCAQCVWTGGVECSSVTCVPAVGACCDRAAAGPTEAICYESTFTFCQCTQCRWSKDETCEDVDCDPLFREIPTVSEWGLVVLALFLLIGGKVYFGRRAFVA